MNSDRKARLDTLAVTSLVLCCFLWGLNQVAAKVAIAEVPPLAQAAIRSLGGAALVFLWARLRGIPLFERDGSLRGGLTAGLLFAAEFGCIFLGLQYTTASRMAVFIYISPFVVALGMPFISKAEKLTSSQLAGLAIAFAGVAWGFAEGFTKPAVGDLQWLGDALGVAAGVLWGATTLAIRGSRLSAASAEKTLLYQLAISGLALALAALLRGQAWAPTLSALTWASMLFQVVVVTFASYLLWFWLMRHYPATRLVIALVAVAVGILLVNRR